MAESGKLVLVATPIGNLGDMSPRAAQALRGADQWLVEDTRVSAKLQAHLGVGKPMRILNEHTSDRVLASYVADVQNGLSVALCTDSGSPGISDPGAELTDLCHEARLTVQAVPGPSAVTAALMLSGFFAQRFCFLGYLPRRPGDIKKELFPFRESPLTLVAFESPLRVDRLLSVFHEVLGPRRYALCREMTKVHEQVYRGRLPAAPNLEELPRKGEFTVVVEGRRRAETRQN